MNVDVNHLADTNKVSYSPRLRVPKKCCPDLLHYNVLEICREIGICGAHRLHYLVDDYGEHFHNHNGAIVQGLPFPFDLPVMAHGAILVDPLQDRRQLQSVR